LLRNTKPKVYLETGFLQIAGATSNFVFDNRSGLLRQSGSRFAALGVVD
jgi:hypothetical protein